MTSETRVPFLAYPVAILAIPLLALIIWSIPALLVGWFGAMVAGDNFPASFWQLVLILSCLPQVWRKAEPRPKVFLLTFRGAFLACVCAGVAADISVWFAMPSAYPAGSLTVAAAVAASLGGLIAEVPVMAHDATKLWRHWKTPKS